MMFPNFTYIFLKLSGEFLKSQRLKYYVLAATIYNYQTILLQAITIYYNYMQCAGPVMNNKFDFEASI